jgi:hypothetical protein
MSFSFRISRKLVCLGVALLGLAAITQAATNLALNKPVTVSSVRSTTANLGPAAVDGNTGTRWESAFSDPQWIYVDLGSSIPFTTVTIVWEAANA